MKILKDDLARYRQSPGRVFRHSFYLVLVLLVVWEFADPTPAVKAQVEKSAPAKVWTQSEKRVIYRALAKFCLAQNYTCETGTYVTFTGSGKIKPVLRVSYPLDWYVTKDLEAVSLHAGRAATNYLKFNTEIAGSVVDRTMIKLVHPNGKEQRFL